MTLTFHPIPTMGHTMGREVTMLGELVVAEIVPCATGRGGYVTLFDHTPERRGLPQPQWVAGREEAREIIRQKFK